MPKVRDEDKDTSTSRTGATVAFRLAPIEERALEALISLKQKDLESRGEIFRASAASVLRTLLKTEAIIKGVWDGAPPAAPPAPAVVLPSKDEIRAMVLKTIKAINTERPDLRRLVTLPLIKDALPGLPGDAINKALLALEGTRQVDLKIANDPTEVEHPEQGFRFGDRGLIYFAILPDERQRTIFEASQPQISAPTPTPPAPKRATKKELSDDELIDLIKQVQSAGVSLAEIGRKLGYQSNAGAPVGRWVRGEKISSEKRPALMAFLLQVKQEKSL